MPVLVSLFFPNTSAVAGILWIVLEMVQSLAQTLVRAVYCGQVGLCQNYEKKAGTKSLPVRRGCTDHLRMLCNRCEPRRGGGKPPHSGCLDETSVLPATSGSRQQLCCLFVIRFGDRSQGIPSKLPFNPHASFLLASRFLTALLIVECGM